MVDPSKRESGWSVRTQSARSETPETGTAVGPFGTAAFLDPWWDHVAPTWLRRVDDEGGAFGRAVFHVLAGYGPGDFATPAWTPRFEQALSSRAGKGIVMPRVVEGSRLHGWVTEHGSDWLEVAVAPRLNLTPGWTEIESRRKAKTWATFRRKGRKLAQHGQVRIISISDPDSAEKWLPTVFRLYQARASVVRRGRLWKSEAGRAFITNWMVRLAHEGALDLSLILVGDRAEAFAFGIVDQQAYYLYGLAFDPGSEVAKWSPGEQLLVHLIRGYAEQGKTYFDFLVGDESYKGAWADERRSVQTHLVGEPLWCRLAGVYPRAKHKLRRILLDR